MVDESVTGSVNRRDFPRRRAHVGSRYHQSGADTDPE